MVIPIGSQGEAEVPAGEAVSETVRLEVWGPAGAEAPGQRELDGLLAAIEALLAERRENVEVSRHSLEKYRELGFLYRFGEVTSNLVDRDALVTASLGLLTSRVALDYFLAVVERPNSGQWELLQAKDREPLETGTFRPEALQELMADGEPRIFNAPADCDVLWEERGAPLGRMAVVPITQGGENRGGLVIGREPDGEAFTSEELHLLSSFGFMFGVKLLDLLLLEELLNAEKLATIGNMASSIIHDFKNPLTSILTFGDLLADFQLAEDERREYARLIVQESQRLSGMIEELLEFARSGRGQYDLSPLSLPDLAQETLESLESELADRGVRLKVQMEGEAMVLADRDKLKRVINNLVGNAGEVLSAGGEVTVTGGADEEGWLCLQDNGPGIPEEIRGRLFEPFVTAGKKTGTGLGTAICKKIIDDLGGRIWFETATGEGTAFHVRLPLAGEADDRRGGP